MQAKELHPTPFLLQELSANVNPAKNNNITVLDVFKTVVFAVQAIIAEIIAFALLVIFFMLFVFDDVNLITTNNSLLNY